MGFIKKLFGLGNKEKVEKTEDLEQQELENGELVEGEDQEESQEDIEVVIHDTEDSEAFELLDEEEVEEELVEKSIEEIIEDVNEFAEQKEKEPEVVKIVEVVTELEETNFLESEEKPKAQLKDDIGIFDNKVEEEIEMEVEKHHESHTELHEDEEPKVVAPEKTDIIDEDVEVIISSGTFEGVTELEVETEETEEVEAEEDSEVNEEVEETEIKEEKVSFFAKLKAGVKKTRDSIFGNINSVFNMFTTIDEDLFEELEEALILADMGVDTSLYIINELRKNVKKNGITEVHEVKDALINIISEILVKDEEELVINPPTVILVIGVNGAGKTTTIGKLSNNFIKSGKSVTVAAADTFRAAAIEQLQVWAERTGAQLIRKEEGSDPASVVFDACQSAKAKNTDVLIVDTAGRLQNKKNLMEELKKINRIIEREYPEANKEVFLVLDSTTGQNAMQQAKLFNETADITGLILTKLDGTAKGGVIVSIKNELQVPVRYVGLGEKVDDLEPFDSKQFAKAMFE